MGKRQRERRFFLALQLPPRNSPAGAMRLVAASASLARPVGERLHTSVATSFGDAV